MTVERKFANVFMASSASGNIRVIKSRKGEALSGIVTVAELFSIPARASLGRDDGGGDPSPQQAKAAYPC